MFVGRNISQLVHVPGNIPKVAHLFVSNALFLHLGLQRRNYRAEISVAAPFTKAIDCALNLNDALFNGNQAVGNGTFAIIMRVDTERRLDMFFNCLDHFRDFERHRTAIGIAEDNAVDIGLLGSLKSFNGVLGVGLIAVKEMLGIIKHFRCMLLQVFQRVKNQFQIFFKRDTQCFMDMKIPGFSKNSNRIRLCLNQRYDVVIFVRGHLGATG